MGQMHLAGPEFWVDVLIRKYTQTGKESKKTKRHVEGGKEEGS